MSILPIQFFYYGIMLFLWISFDSLKNMILNHMFFSEAKKNKSIAILFLVYFIFNDG